MAERTTKKRVSDVIEVDSCISLIPFIRVANVLTNQLHAADVGGLANDETLLEIETFLAAHFYQHNRDRQLSSGSTGKASGVYDGKTAMILLATPPGQSAVMMDPTGFLAKRSADAASGKMRAIGIEWLGTPSDSPRPDDYSSYGY